MPWLPKRACSGCGQAVSGPCPTCERKRQQQVDSRRGSARERGYDERWQAESRAWRYDPEHRERLYCADPFGLHARPKLSECVDHVVPHRGDPVKFWNRENWQALCLRCNTIKANRFEGGFGNRARAV